MADASTPPRRRAWARATGALRHLLGHDILREPTFLIGFAIILAFTVMAVVGPYVLPHDPETTDLTRGLESPSGDHWLGTDRFGRDVFARVVEGGRISLAVAVTSVTISMVFGVALGTIGGFLGSFVDRLIVAIVNILLSFPAFLLALVCMAVRGPGLLNVIFAIAISYVPRVAVVVRAVVLTIKPQEYIEACYAMGVPRWRIIVRHVVPNSLPPVIVVATLSAATAILAEAGLSFLGLGVTPPAPTWGNIITEGRPYIVSHPFISLSAGVCIALLVIAFNILGDALRDQLDPRLQKRLGVGLKA